MITPSLDNRWIQTYTGLQFFPFNPRVEDLSIFDIAHALSNICRFAGHTEYFYSVAQHSCYVHDLCLVDYGMTALLHDASEAYIIDLPRPIKRSPQFEFYLNLESKIMKSIAERYKIIYPLPQSVVDADAAMLGTEARQLMNPHCLSKWSYLPDAVEGLVIEPWSPTRAKNKFLERFAAIVDRQKETSS